MREWEYYSVQYLADTVHKDQISWCNTALNSVAYMLNVKIIISTNYYRHEEPYLHSDLILHKISVKLARLRLWSDQMTILTMKISSNDTRNTDVYQEHRCSGKSQSLSEKIGKNYGNLQFQIQPIKI